MTHIAALTQDKARMEASGSYGRPVNAISKMLLLCGLLCEYFEYDEKREEFTKEMENVGISLEVSEETIHLVYALPNDNPKFRQVCLNRCLLCCYDLRKTKKSRRISRFAHQHCKD